MYKNLTSLLTSWDAWAASADKSDDGWQSDYPRWVELMDAAAAAMEQPDQNVAAIEKCWLLSEEDEWCAEHVRKNPGHYLDLLMALSKSKYPSVRWQVYASLEETGSVGVHLLESGLVDPDAYARRRAVLALAKARPAVVLQKMNEFCNDPDEVNRRIFLRLKEELSSAAIPSA